MNIENLDLKFQPGDRVILLRDFDHIEAGDTGTFVHEDKDDWPELGVRWDKKHPVNHNCSKNCEYGHGWYVPRGYLAFEEVVDFGDLPEVGHGEVDLLFDVQ